MRMESLARLLMAKLQVETDGKTILVQKVSTRA
jgi:hypothetical protein